MAEQVAEKQRKAYEATKRSKQKEKATRRLENTPMMHYGTNKGKNKTKAGASIKKAGEHINDA